MAAVIRVMQWQAAPGKQAEMLGLMREAVPLWEKHGAKVRILSNQIAGPNSTTVSFVSEYESMAAFGAAADRIGADPDAIAFQKKVNDAQVGSMLSSSLSVELPSR